MKISRGVLLFAAVVVIGGLSPVAAKGAEPGFGAFLDEAVPAQLAELKVPGAAVVVVRGGRQVFAKGYGYADAARRTPVDPDRTGFQGGSIAKAFTATAVLRLVERGRVDLDADANRYLKDVRIPDTYPGRPVTVRHLLTHAAGFDPRVIGEAAAGPGGLTSLREHLRASAPARIRPPGAVSYDNHAFAYAGLLVEDVSGRPFDRFVRDEITGPLGMARTSQTQPRPAALERSLATGHRPDGAGQTPVRGRYVRSAPTGGVVTTATDMGRFLNAHLGHGPRVLTDATRRTMQARHAGAPGLPGVGLMWERRERAGRLAVGKDGDTLGFHAGMALLPATDTGVFVVYNGDGTTGTGATAARTLLDRFTDRFGGPARQSAAAVPARSLDRYTGTYRTLRTTRNDLTRVQALTGAVTVSAENGGLVTRGHLSPDPDRTEQHWTPVGDGLFQERGGPDRLSLTSGRLATSADPTSTYERLPWYATPPPAQLTLAAAVLILLPTTVLLPLMSLRRRARGSRLATALAWTTSLLVAGFLAATAALMSDPNRTNEILYLGDDPLLTTLTVLPLTIAAASLALLATTVTAWLRGWWTRPTRLHHTATTVATCAFTAVAASYGLLGA
ncbi:serine hydrolase domain-containing protein [Actinomadura flavalba]|uniref:serine hydrolase domain-containing protein n=1 Tax=Actinomadura flavalba TaxID=1120938 RepID=UPI0003A76B87|nr:serine hydrolase domain-containing protein [Actinomadura flavalba]